MGFITSVFSYIYEKVYNFQKLLNKLVIQVYQSEKILDFIYRFRLKLIQDCWNIIFYHFYSFINKYKTEK